jgi:hypothetical protein
VRGLFEARAAGAIAATIGALVWTTPAAAMTKGSFDPGRAQADANAVLAELHAFCEHPKPLPSGDALRLCPLASEIHDCAGFAKQCADALGKEPVHRPSPILEAIARFIAAIAPAVGWTVLVLGVGTLLWLIGFAIWRRFARPDEIEQTEAPATDVSILAPPAAAPVETGSAEAILARAEAALARGDLQAALFGFLHASLRALDVRGAIRIARDRTNGEYVRSCNDERARPELRAIVHEVDVVQFGGRQAEVERVRDAGRRAAAVVRMAVTLALVAIGSLLAGCKSSPAQRAADPAGFEVAQALLERQGFTLRSPDKALAELEPPSGDEATAPMLLDVARTPLDSDAVEGLERWVNGGGDLVLFGPVWEWPPAFRAARVPTQSRDVVVEVRASIECDEATDECEDAAARALTAPEPTRQRARLAEPAAFRWDGQDGEPLAHHAADATVYASVGKFGAGSVLAVASSDLLTNAGLAREGNPGALITILSRLPGREIVVIDERGGITPSGNPFSSLMSAGLGLPMAHAFAFALIAAFAVGARNRAARPLPQHARRAFVEHVEATGSLYAYAKAAPHALASYGRFVVERLRTRMAKGADLATTLAHRSGASREECQRVLDRATLVKAGDARRGDELATLRELAELYARAADPMSPGAPFGSSVTAPASSGPKPGVLHRFGRRRDRS